MEDNNYILEEIRTGLIHFIGCMFEGAEVGNGLTVSPAGQPCRRCECSSGVISCRDPICDCSVRGGSASDKCCPQCDPSAACTHQELKHVIFRSGERWIYQCQTCECLVSFFLLPLKYLPSIFPFSSSHFTVHDWTS